MSSRSDKMIKRCAIVPVNPAGFLTVPHVIHPSATITSPFTLQCRSVHRDHCNDHCSCRKCLEISRWWPLSVVGQDQTRQKTLLSFVLLAANQRQSRPGKSGELKIVTDEYSAIGRLDIGRGQHCERDKVQNHLQMTCKSLGATEK